MSCPVTGNTFKKIRMRAEGRAGSPTEAIRSAIQNFLDGCGYVYQIEYYDTPTVSFVWHDHVDFIDLSDMKEPFLSLFQDLFDHTKWTMQKMLPQQEVY